MAARRVRDAGLLPDTGGRAELRRPEALELRPDGFLRGHQYDGHGFRLSLIHI